MASLCLTSVTEVEDQMELSWMKGVPPTVSFTERTSLPDLREADLVTDAKLTHCVNCSCLCQTHTACLVMMHSPTAVYCTDVPPHYSEFGTQAIESLRRCRWGLQKSGRSSGALMSKQDMSEESRGLSWMQEPLVHGPRMLLGVTCSTNGEYLFLFICPSFIICLFCH